MRPASQFQDFSPRSDFPQVPETDLPPFPAAWMEVLPRNITEKALELRETVCAPRVYPPASRVFRALDLTSPDAVRVVILGQDPYPTLGHADGLCFSVDSNIWPLPPSLRNIFREYSDCLGFPSPSCGNLAPWAKNGVLLLNAILTVPDGRPNGHRRAGWQPLTDAVLQACLRLPDPMVFLLWGKEAQKTFQRAASRVTPAVGDGTIRKPDVEVLPGKYVLCSSHPSPLGASRACGNAPAFLGSRPFSRANDLLGNRAVFWKLP